VRQANHQAARPPKSGPPWGMERGPAEAREGCSDVRGKPGRTIK
jgi:hypothetical protein